MANFSVTGAYTDTATVTSDLASMTNNANLFLEGAETELLALFNADTGGSSLTTTGGSIVSNTSLFSTYNDGSRFDITGSNFLSLTGSSSTVAPVTNITLTHGTALVLDFSLTGNFSFVDATGDIFGYVNSANFLDTATGNTMNIDGKIRLKGVTEGANPGFSINQSNDQTLTISHLKIAGTAGYIELFGNIYGNGTNVAFGTITKLIMSDANATLTLDNVSLDASILNSTSTLTNYASLEALALTGNDTITGSSSNDNLHGYTGNDTLSGNGGNDNISGGDGDDILNGNLGDDLLYGNIGNDQLLGGQGNDQLFGGQGNDILTGALGDDTLAGALGDDTLKGGQGNDQLLGGQGNDALLGALGNDSLTGALGNDMLAGGDGNDTLTGAGGLDTFVFDFALNATTNVDTITDFVSGSDKIQLSASIFTALGAGVLNVNNFVSGANVAALDASDRILYDTNTGSLYYDADGSASGAKVLFATLTANPGLVAADVSVV